MWSLGATIVFLLVLQGLVHGQPDLFITHPKTVIKGREFPVDIVFSSPAEEAESLTVSFLQSSESFIRAIGQDIARINFMVDSTVRDREGYVTVSKTMAGTQLVQSDSISIRNISSTTIIQTDKGKYKPGQSVLFRILNVDSDLKPLQNDVTVIVKDPADNTVYEKKSNATASERGGIIDGNCTLIDDAPLGQYKIVVYGITKKEAIFTVEKYTLPKFKTMLTLDVSSVAKTPNMKSIPIKGEVKAVYTYGQFVTGKLTLNVDGEPKIIKEPFDGFRTIDIELTNREYLTAPGRQMLKIQAIVEEGTTGNTANTSDMFTILPVPFTAQPEEPIPDYSENDEFFDFQVRLVDAVGGTLGWEGDDATATLSNYKLHYEYYQEYRSTSNSVDVTTNPVNVRITGINRQTRLSSNQLKVWFEYIPLALESEKVPVEVRKLVSNSNDYITVVLTESDQVNQACFKIDHVDVTDNQAYYQVVGNGYQSEMEVYNPTLNKHCFSLTQEHAPLFEVIGYKITKDESPEILVNRVVGTHTETIQSQVSMSVNPGTVKPGGSVTIEFVTSAPGNSFIGLRAVDKSSILLQRGHDVSQTKIDKLRMIDRLFNNDIDRDAPDYPIIIEPMPFFSWRGPYEASVSPGSIMRDAGLSLKATKTLKFYTCAFCGGGDIMYDEVMFDAEIMPNVAPGAVDDGEPVRKGNDVDLEVEADTEADNTRKDFPETWVWDLREIQTGITQFQETVPDTITNWVIDVFSLNPTSGLEVIPTQELTVTKPLFISMNLPYSIVRGEQFTLQILVFNYNTRDVNVRVTLQSSTEFMVPDGHSLTGTFNIGAKSNGVLEVPIKATTVGEVMLAATVEQVGNATNNDNVERMLLVEAEGRRLPNFIDLTVESLNTQSDQTFNIDLMELVSDKETFVDGSLTAYVQVEGDVMGSYVSGLEDKFGMPYGCGEQNIISMTPGLFVGKYLQALDKLILDDELRVQKATQSGYSRELNYRHDDGSFSAFGKSDKSGSTWLTAYVLKMFSILGEEGFADGILNPVILANAFDFIKANVREGRGEYYAEPGKVLHNNMKQGESSNGFSAYITISVQDYYDYLVTKGDSENRMNNVTKLLQEASSWLYRASGGSLSGLSRPLIAYTLARSGTILSNTDYITFAENLMEGFTLMETPKKKPVSKGMAYKPDAGDVERNGYALLAYLTLYKSNTLKRMTHKGKAEEAMSWLIKSRGADGFFSSTQDTAVGLQAIAEYAITFPEANAIDFSVQVGQNTNKMVVNNDNYYIMQQQQVDMSQLNSNNLNVQVTGSSGKPLVKVVVYFNIKRNVTGSSMNVTIEKRIPPGYLKPYLRIRVTEITGENLIPPGTMIVCDMTLPTGFAAEEIDGRTISRKDISQNRQKLTAYFMNDAGQISSKDGLYFDVNYDVQFDIKDPEPGRITIYDYYQSDNNVALFYSAANEAAIVDPEEPTTGAAGIAVNLILIGLTSLVIIIQKSFF